MKAKTCVAILCFLLLNIEVKVVEADQMASVLDSLYQKMVTVFTSSNYQKTTAVPPSEVIKSNQNLVLVCVYPGIPIAKPLSSEPSIEDQVQISELANVAPPLSSVYQERSLTLPEIYRYILDNSVISDKDLSITARRRLDEAYAVIEDTTKPGNISERYRRYLSYRSEYINALDAIQLAKIEKETLGTPYPTRLDDNLKKAEKNWKTYGYKDVVELALKTIVDITKNDLVRWKEDRDCFDSLLLPTEAGEIPLTLTFPSYKDWSNKDGWINLHWSQQGDKANSKKSLVTAQNGLTINSRGTSSDGLPVFTMSKSAKDAITRVTNQSRSISTSTLNCTAAAARTLSDPGSITVDNISITAKLKRVKVERPWLDESIFTSQFWKFSSGNGSQILSAGPDALRRPENELLPLLVDSIILADEVEISAIVSAKEVNVIIQAQDLIKNAPADATVGIGPFSIAGRAAWRSSSLTSRVNINGKTVRPWGNTRSFGFISSEYKGLNAIKVSVSGLQLVGYVCRMVPKSPNPSPWATF